MASPRPTVRIAVMSPEATRVEAAAWRERLAAEIAGASVAHLPIEGLRDTSGAPVHIDVEIAILFAPDSQGEADAEVDALLRSVERGANDPNSISSARVIVVGNSALLHAP
ncbi:MAG: hypothetical protein RLY72_2105, partial [Planctomycetota bacterium]